MDNSIIVNEIQFWNEKLNSSSGHDNKLYELSFFKIFVKFELFLTKLFIKYSIGECSNSGYTPNRRLSFANKEHFEGVLKNKKASFIDYPERIQTLSPYIFNEGNDPFTLIFTDAGYNSYYNQMKCIRNYIAHESDESKAKYHKTVIGLTNSFIEPFEYLTNINRRYGKSNYTIYIEKMIEVSEIILDPNPYLGQDYDIGLAEAAISSE